MYHSFTLAASLLTFLPTVFAAGTAHVINNCGFDVYYASVSQGVGAAMQKVPSGGYSESYNKPNNGISIKLATSLGGPVTQFEYTWDSPNVAYDISNIDGNPFMKFGTSLVPSQAGAAGYPTCVALSCPAGVETCTDAYNMPDDVQTRVCPETSDLTFTLCPGGASNNAPPAQSSAQQSATPSQPAISSQPAVPSQPVAPSQPAAASSSPVFGGRPSAVPSAPASFDTPSAPAAQPTSFRTYTTPAASQPVITRSAYTTTPRGQPVVTQSALDSPIASQAPVASSQQYQAPSAPSLVQSSPAEAATTTQAAAQTTAPAEAPAQSWSWGHWGHWDGHHHTRRGHIHRFRS